MPRGCDGILSDSAGIAQCSLEFKKTATPTKRLTRVFDVLDKSLIQLGTGAVIYMADKLSDFAAATI